MKDSTKINENGDGPGNINPNCPYCDKRLEKRPQRKKKCPHCGSYIYVRTRPNDRKKVLVTEEGAKNIDMEWTRVQGTSNLYKDQEERFSKRKQELSNRFGLEASDFDVQWSLLNEDSLVHAKNINWGLYRNTRFQMAEQLKLENRARQALHMFIEVLYIDQNGPCNRGSIMNSDLLAKFPMFDPNVAILAPAILNEIRTLSKELNLSTSDLRDDFLEISQIHHDSLNLPVAPQEVWHKLKVEFE